MICICNICSLIIPVSFGDCYGTHIYHPCDVRTIELIIFVIGTYYFDFVSMLKLFKVPMMNGV